MENKMNWRLVTDWPETNVDSILNLFYVKDGQAWVRGGGPTPEYPDVTLNDFVRRIVMQHALTPYMFDELTDEKVSEVMADWLSDWVDSLEGIVGTLYAAGWAFAELRARLKIYEDARITPNSVNRSNWISVDERLPDGHENVLVCRVLPNGRWRVEQGSLEVNGWWKVYGTRIKRVRFWMPLPAPPEDVKG